MIIGREIFPPAAPLVIFLKPFRVARDASGAERCHVPQATRAYCRLFAVVAAVLMFAAAAAAQDQSSLPGSAQVLDGFGSATSGIPASREVTIAIERLDKPAPLFKTLLVAFGSLEAADVYTTLRAVHGGETESNPLMRSAANHPLALASAKAGSAAITVFLTQRLVRRHRTAGLVMTGALDAVLGAVAVHNARQVHR
jgi:hypothetical protein